MYFTLGDILLVMLFGAAGLFFLESIRVRELAIAAVQRQAKESDFQLLDQSVQVHKLSLSRNDKGRWSIWRQYRFEYSYEGVERRRGNVIMLGKKLQSVVVSERNPTLH